MGTAYPIGEAPHRYDRAILLSAELRNADKRNQVLEMCEVQRPHTTEPGDFEGNNIDTPPHTCGRCSG